MLVLGLAWSKADIAVAAMWVYFYSCRDMVGTVKPGGGLPAGG